MVAKIEIITGLEKDARVSAVVWHGQPIVNLADGQTSSQIWCILLAVVFCCMSCCSCRDSSFLYNLVSTVVVDGLRQINLAGRPDSRNCLAAFLLY